MTTRERHLVLRADGRAINVPRRPGQLFVCSTGCCCGRTEDGHAAVPTDLYHQEWERRRLRNRVHLTQSGCLGPCTLANVALLVYGGREIWFHSVADERVVTAMFDYIDAMVRADSPLPPPPALAGHVFTAFDWEARRATAAVERAPVDAARVAPRVADTILFLTQADTDLLTMEKARVLLPPDFPPVRAVNVSGLGGDEDIDIFLDRELDRAALVVARLLGGRASFAHGLDRLATHARREGTWTLLLPGTETLDVELAALSSVAIPVAHQAAAYLQMGGPSNAAHLLRFLADHLLTTGFGFDAPAPQPRHGVYHPDAPNATLDELLARHRPDRPTVGVLFYRAHLLAGNTDPIDALVRACEKAEANVLPVFAQSLKEDADDVTAHDGSRGLPAALRYMVGPRGARVDVIVSTMSFAMGGVNPDGPTMAGWSVDALESLDVPILQAVLASGPRVAWETSLRGLGPLDTAMNVALPEFDGRIAAVPIAFKEQSSGPSDDARGAPVARAVAVPDRVERTVGLALRLSTLRHKPNGEKRVAIVLTNNPNRAARVGNAVGLDAPASLLLLLEAMRAAGYTVGDLPASGDDLLHALIDRCSYDTEVLTAHQLAYAAARVPEGRYASWFAGLPMKNRREMSGRWGEPPGVAYVHGGHLALAGLRFGNVFVALQPPRGYGMDPNAIYHQPDLPPTHNYHALYRWLRDPVALGGFGIDALIHLGKHGTLEWLPGKAVGPSATCYPDLLLDDIPLVYPFIINNPGEGAQAKRRTHAVVVDHMVPPMTAADTYGPLAELARLVDEYYQVELLDPTKLPLLQNQIWEIIKEARLESDLGVMMRQTHGDHTHAWDDEVLDDGTPAGLGELGGRDVAHLLEDIDAYLCELGTLQIRNGLHIMGALPEGPALVDLLLSLVRLPNGDTPSLREAVASLFGVRLRQLLDAPGARLDSLPHVLAAVEGRPLVTASDAIEAIDRLCMEALRRLHEVGFNPEAVADVLAWLGEVAGADATPIATPLQFVCERLLPALRQGERAEIANVLRALDGRYIPAGPSGSPTRGMAHVLPTGRNFYAVDPRAVPSQAAWRVGRQLAEELVRRHLAEEGGYPRSVGLSIWGTSAMRTHGDDIAQVFALLGVRPVWQPESRRLEGVEPIPLAELGRPRIDVVCRISGFFRDAFPHLIGLLNDAVRLVAGLDEPPDDNYVRARYLADQERLRGEGCSDAEAGRRALYRVFGCKPGAYGAGILPLIDERNWHDVSDFAEAYVNWGGYAYTSDEFGVDARDEFRGALATVAVAAKNQDNREHDIFDSDDYLQYHGGMIATIRALSGRTPRRYLGDSSDPERVRVRDLREEALRVFRSRVVNPKWIEAITRHGYKGALELTATVDFLFGYDATADVVEDWMYETVTKTYALDPTMQEFFGRSSPWALRDIAERLLEAADRGLWSHPSAEITDGLRRALLRAEADVEARGEI